VSSDGTPVLFTRWLLKIWNLEESPGYGTSEKGDYRKLTNYLYSILEERSQTSTFNDAEDYAALEKWQNYLCLFNLLLYLQEKEWRSSRVPVSYTRDRWFEPTLCCLVFSRHGVSNGRLCLCGFFWRLYVIYA
jgi:hypothetical protein